MRNELLPSTHSVATLSNLQKRKTDISSVSSAGRPKSIFTYLIITSFRLCDRVKNPANPEQGLKEDLVI